MTEAPRVISATGKITVMHTISPVIFVEFRRWLADLPNREPAEAGCAAGLADPEFFAGEADNVWPRRLWVSDYLSAVLKLRSQASSVAANTLQWTQALR